MSAVVWAGETVPEVGSLEEHYRQSAAFRAASDQTRVTPTHIHIAIANGLGWGFDGMDGVIFALASPLLIRDFGLTIPNTGPGCRSRCWSASSGCSCGPGWPTATAGGRCWHSISRCSR